MLVAGSRSMSSSSNKPTDLAKSEYGSIRAALGQRDETCCPILSMFPAGGVLRGQARGSSPMVAHAIKLIIPIADALPLVVGNKVTEIKSGAFVVIGPDCQHLITSDAPRVAVYFDPENVRSVSHDIGKITVIQGRSGQRMSGWLRL